MLRVPSCRRAVVLVDVDVGNLLALNDLSFISIGTARTKPRYARLYWLLPE